MLDADNLRDEVDPIREDRPPSAGQSRLPDARTLRVMGAASSYRVRDLADQLGISPRHLRRLFMRQMSSCPKRWLREERLMAAARLLPFAASVKGTALSLGFRNESQFCRDFRQRFGRTPLEAMRTGAPSLPGVHDERSLLAPGSELGCRSPAMMGRSQRSWAEISRRGKMAL